jgi:phage baseplate assembly protein W
MATTIQPYGITLPITHGPQGYFNQSYTIIDQVKSNLNLLLRTKKGERRMNPDFGSGLWSILFENYTDDISPLIENTIRKDINVSNVQVNTDDTEFNDKYTISVKVLFTVPSIGITQQQTLEVSMNTSNI